MSILVLLTASISFSFAAAQQHCRNPTDTIEVAKGIYVRQGIDDLVFEGVNIANVGFIVGEKCVAVIDSGGSLQEGHALRCTIALTTDLPICYVINTHFHPDHILGNHAFREKNTLFIGHERLAQAIGIAADTYLQRASLFENRKVAEAELVLPQRTVGDTLELDLGERILKISAHSAAHTRNDISIFDQKTNTLWLSDLLFLTHTPVVAGSITGWINTLNQLKDIKAERVIPGHGPVSAKWPDSLDRQLDYLNRLRSEVKDAIAKGVSIIEAQENLLKDNPWQWKLYSEYRKRNIINAYAELEWED